MNRDDDTIRRLLNEAAPASHGVSAEAVARRAGKVQRRRTAATWIAVPVATLATVGVAVAGVQLLSPDDGRSEPPVVSSPSATVSDPTPTSSPSPTTPQTGTFTYTSLKGVTIELDNLPEGATISSPVTITGRVPGSWSFEADFPVVLVDWDGRIIAEGIGTLQGDWMTEELVPFEVTLRFKTPSYQNTGALILQKDNPSGLAKHDDAVEIPVTFE